MSKIIYILLLAVLASCSKNSDSENLTPEHRVVFFGGANIKDFGSVCMMADTLTGDNFDVAITTDLAKLFPEIVSSVDIESVYTSNEYEFYKLCSLKPGCEYPKMTLAFSGFEFMDVEVKVVDFTDQGWVLEYYAPHLKSGWPCIIIGTGGAKKYLCNSESNPQKWTSWSDITIETGNGYSFNFIKDRMDESAIVPYNWKLNL